MTKTRSPKQTDARIEDAPVSAVLKRVRPSRYGSVPGLDDSELADPDELERQAAIAEWEPILSLPATANRRWVKPVVEEDGFVHYGAFSMVDFERTHPPVDVGRYRTARLREELRDVLIRFDVLKERMPGMGKDLVLKYLRMGVINQSHIVDADMAGLARLRFRADRLQHQIRKTSGAAALRAAPELRAMR